MKLIFSVGHHWFLPLKCSTGKAFKFSLAGLRYQQFPNFSLHSLFCRSTFALSTVIQTVPVIYPVASSQRLFFHQPIASIKLFLLFVNHIKRYIMKNTNTHMRNILSVITLAAFFLLAAAPAMANTEKSKATVAVEVKYVGSADQSPVLEVSFNNDAAEEMTVVIRDMDGNVLFTEIASDKKYARKFKFDNHSTEPIKIKVSMASKKGSTTEIYQVSRNQQVIEQVVVSKL